MIPKIIHYCWFGRKPLPGLAKKCIASWKKYLPDYEIKEWNEDNFDVDIIPYTKEAYLAGKYAFVSDYARFWILYQYGGLYFDTDVELIQLPNKVLDKGPFMAAENLPTSTRPLMVAPGLGLSAEAGMQIYNDILVHYSSMAFVREDGGCNYKTVVQIVTDLLRERGLDDTCELQQVAGLYIWPKEYFAPINTVGGRIEITSKTVSIHHYAGSWMPFIDRMKLRIGQLLGPDISVFIIKLKEVFLEILRSSSLYENLIFRRG